MRDSGPNDRDKHVGGAHGLRPDHRFPVSQGRRTAPLPPDWPITRARILERDNNRCHVCDGPGAAEVDHVIPAAEGGTDNDTNLAAIHVSCHRSKTGREASRARARRYDRRHPPEDHPGLR